jgi:hypothetical protein
MYIKVEVEVDTRFGDYAECNPVRGAELAPLRDASRATQRDAQRTACSAHAKGMMRHATCGVLACMRRARRAGQTRAGRSGKLQAMPPRDVHCARAPHAPQRVCDGAHSLVPNAAAAAP